MTSHNLATSCRVASLLAFYESRDGECDESDKGPGGQFAPGNDCGGSGSGPAVIPLPAEGAVNLNAAKLLKSPPFRGAQKLQSLQINNVKGLRQTAKALGNSTIGELMKMLVADVPDSHVKIQVGLRKLTSSTNVFLDSGDTTKGSVRISNSITIHPNGESTIDYGTLDPSNDAKESSASELANEIMDRMLDSLSAADGAGVTVAETHAAGDPTDKKWQGYRLWGKFGFDADIPRPVSDSIPDSVLGDDAKRSRDAGDRITLQQLLATPQGTKWWQENGVPLNMYFDFREKESLGYKRFQRLLATRERHRKRKKGADSRSFMQWLYETCDVSERSLIEYRNDNCGTGAGGFQQGNKCGEGEGGKTPVAKGLRKKGSQTDMARKLYSIGTTERKVSKLIADLGGDPKKSELKINGNRVNVQIRNKAGEATHFLEIRYSGARLYPLKSNTSDADAAKQEKMLREAMPEKYNKKSDAGYSVSVKKSTKDFDKWKKEDDARIKSVEDKYRFSLELPPHQRPKEKKGSRSLMCRQASLIAFAESRNCGTGSGGFQKGNTCAGAGAASGALSGAAKGAAVGFSVGGLYGVAPGAAAGAAVGAATGAYSAKTEPARVSKKITELGVSDEKVSTLVKKLGGSPKSTATVKNKKLVIDIKGDSGKSRFSVEMDKDTVTITPKSKAAKLSDAEIKSVTKLAKEFSPKSVGVVVKATDKSFIKKLAAKGITVAATAGGLFIARWAAPAMLGEVEGSLGKYRREDAGQKPRRNW